ncbi:MAG TPA: hypothetical protein VL128_07535 [Candidatus Eisenbacteria bacterium]|nr:hypothetical protein [Candidatus Eisenbacteria bacterium]
MEHRIGIKHGSRALSTRSASFFYFLVSIFYVVAGCGAPGEPVPPTPPVPQAIVDLAAKQAGPDVLLTFTMPSKSTLGDSLPQTPAFEVSRSGLGPGGQPDRKSFRVVDTVPGALVSRYLQRDQVNFMDPISPSDPQLLAGAPFVYRVRTLISDRHPSAFSNDVSVQLFPVPESIGQVNANVTEHGIELKWQPPTKNSFGQGLPAVKEYHVYRGELNPASANQPPSERLPSAWKVPFALLGVAATPDYRDSGFDYGQTYVYVVRSVVESPAGPLESGDSNETIVTPRDTFPPAAPQDVVAAVEPGAAPGSPVVELSWSINIEPDLAGYRVYRVEQEGSRGSLLTPQLLPSPAYRDSSVSAGHHYWYTVTAVDLSGNESAPSAAVAVDVAQLSR